MLIAERQFRGIIGYRDLAMLVIAIERRAIVIAAESPDREEVAERVTPSPLIDRLTVNRGSPPKFHDDPDILA